MKKTLIITFAMLCFLGIEMYAQADYTPCLPDCENDEWIPDISQPAFEMTIVLCNKEFTLRYRYRVACNRWYDYYIEGVTYPFATNSILDCITNGYQGSMALFMQAVSEQLMIANPANFPPHNVPDCELMWRVLKGGCFFRGSTPGVGGVAENDKKPNSQDMILSSPTTWGSPEFLAPCPSIHCCLEKYNVCMTPSGLTVTLTDYQPPLDPECVDAPVYMDCEPVCGSVYNR